MTATLSSLVQQQKEFNTVQTRQGSLIKESQLRLERQQKSIQTSSAAALAAAAAAQNTANQAVIDAASAQATADSALALAQANEPSVVEKASADSPYTLNENETVHCIMDGDMTVIVPQVDSIYPVEVIRVGASYTLTIQAPSGYTIEGDASKTIDFDGTAIKLISAPGGTFVINSDHDFTSGWTAVGGASINSAQEFVTTGVNGIFRTGPYVTVGDNLRIKVEGTTTTSAKLELKTDNTPDIYQELSTAAGSFSKEFFVTALDEGFYFRGDGANVVNITTFEVEILKDSVEWRRA